MGPFRAETVTWLELVWSLAALVGLGFTLWMHRDAMGDRRLLRRSGRNGSRLLVANALIRWERLRAVKMLLFLAVGLAAMTREDPPQVLTPVVVLYSALALYVPVSNVWGSVRDRQDRARLLGYLEREEAAKRAGGC